MLDDLTRSNYLSDQPTLDLIPGGQYEILTRGGCGLADLPEPVTLIGFTPYPATVVVLDRQNRRLYCDRRHLRRLPGGISSVG